MLAEKQKHSCIRSIFSQLGAAYESLDIATIAVDKYFHIVFFNDKASRITGYPREKVMRKSIFYIAVSKELKKRLSLALKEDARDAGFVTRGSIVTRDGRVRAVEWRGIALYGEGKAEGILLTGIDVTETEMAKEVARVAARARDIKEMALGFMDLLGGPLNLKIARMSIFTDHCDPITFSKVFPHGGVRKRPRLAIDDTSDDRELDVRYFKLCPGDRSIGMIKATAYAGSRLNSEDVDCVQALCDIISAGIIRLLPAIEYRTDLINMHNTNSAMAVINPRDYRIIDASSGFCKAVGKKHLKGTRIEQALSSPGLIEVLRSTRSDQIPRWGISPEIGSVYCCVPVKGFLKGSGGILISLMGSLQEESTVGRKLAYYRSGQAEHILSILPHGLAVCDARGIVVTANDALASLLEMEKAQIEGRVFDEIIMGLSPERVDRKPLSRRRLATYRAMKTGSPVTGSMLTVKVRGSIRTLNSCAFPINDENGDMNGYVVTLRDATVLAAIINIGRFIIYMKNVDDLIDESLDTIMNAARIKLVWLYLYEGNELLLKVQKGDFTGAPLPLCRDIPDQDSPTLQSRAFRKNKPLLIKDYGRCASVRMFDPIARSRNIKSAAAIPLRSDGRTIGVLVAFTDSGKPIMESGLAELSAMCDQLSIGLERSAQYTRTTTIINSNP